jgi:hypothetical protein
LRRQEKARTAFDFARDHELLLVPTGEGLGSLVRIAGPNVERSNAFLGVNPEALRIEGEAPAKAGFPFAPA